MEITWKEALFDFLKMIGIATLGCVIFILILILMPTTHYHYEYIDLDNNNGVAPECSYKFVYFRSGGQGSPVCELEDGTVKKVKEYKYIFEDNYSIYDEIKGDK